VLLSIVVFMLPIPFYKPSIGDEEINEVVDTLRGGWLTTGPKVKQFESEFSQYLGHRHSVALNSCTAALHLALEAIGLKSGQTVVVPTMTFAATARSFAISMPFHCWWTAVLRILTSMSPMPDGRSKPLALAAAMSSRLFQSITADKSAMWPVFKLLRANSICE